MMTMSFVKPGIEAPGGLNAASADFDQGSVIGGADPSQRCKDICAF
jgi:hypothetical protein